MPRDLPLPVARPGEREDPLEEARKLFRPPEGETNGLWIWLVESSPESALEVDEDTLEALRALGYVGP